MPRDHDHGQGGIALPEARQDLEAVDARHLDVEDDDVRPAALHGGEAVLARGGLDELVPLVLEDHPQGGSDVRLVVDDEDQRLAA